MSTHAPIKTERAIEIARSWMSPSDHDDQLSRLGHAMIIEDWERLQDQVERTLRENPEDPANELHELLGWVIFKKKSVGGIKT